MTQSTMEILMIVGLIMVPVLGCFAWGFLVLRADIGGVRKEVRADIADVRREIGDVRKEVADVRKELKADIADVRKEVADVRRELKADIADVRKEVADVRADMTNIRKELAAQDAKLGHICGFLQAYGLKHPLPWPPPMKPDRIAVGE